MRITGGGGRGARWADSGAFARTDRQRRGVIFFRVMFDLYDPDQSVTACDVLSSQIEDHLIRVATREASRIRGHVVLFAPAAGHGEPHAHIRTYICAALLGGPCPTHGSAFLYRVLIEPEIVVADDRWPMAGGGGRRVGPLNRARRSKLWSK